MKLKGGFAIPMGTRRRIDLLIQADSLARAQQAAEPLGFWGGTALMSFHGGKVKIARLCKVVSPEGLILLKSFRRSGVDEDDIAFLRSISDED